MALTDADSCARQLRVPRPVVFVIPPSGIAIGRDPRSDVPLADSRVSRRHAILWMRAGRYYVRDEGSTNGTFVNDKRIEGTTELQLGDELRLGSTVFILQQAPKAERRGAGGFPVAPIVAGVGASSLICVLVMVALVVSRIVPALPQATGTTAAEATAEAFVSVHGVAATVTQDGHYGALAAYEDGERLAVMTDVDASGSAREVAGAVWLSPEGNALVVHAGPDGLPQRAVVGEVILLFSRYTAVSVDVAVVSPNGSVEIIRGVSVDPGDLSQLTALRVHTTSGASSHALGKPLYRTGGLSLGTTLKAAAVLVRVVACVYDVIKYAAVPPALILAAVPCTSALISAIDLLVDSDLITATSLYLDQVACVHLRHPVAGAALILDLAGHAATSTDETVEARQRSIEQAENTLAAPTPTCTHTPVPPIATRVSPTPTYVPPTATLAPPTATPSPRPPTPVLGTGDVKATLTWNSSADLDLHVTDPYGEEIYFGHDRSDSGGELDYDDLCGDRSDGGPENIFWPRGQAPHGQYEVSVHYFSECVDEGSTSYEVTILVDGRTWSTTGLISPDETQHVRTFTR